MELMISAPLPGKPGSTHNYVHNNDEAWVSTVMHINQIFLNHDHRYFMYTGNREQMLRLMPKRPIRTFYRQKPPENKAPVDAFAFCVYLNWGGWHQTPVGTILDEYRQIWENNKSFVAA
jgi:hypothetical protein